MMHDLITSYGGTCDIEQPKKRLKRCCHFRKMQQCVILDSSALESIALKHFNKGMCFGTLPVY